MQLPPVPPKKFSKDHWTLLAMIDTQHAGGEKVFLDPRRMRCNPYRHPQHALDHAERKWKNEFGTRLQGYFECEGRYDPIIAEEAGVQIGIHDDWDCLTDLENGGFIKIIDKQHCVVTEKGMDAITKLRAHKQQGGQYARFVYA